MLNFPEVFLFIIFLKSFDNYLKYLQILLMRTANILLVLVSFVPNSLRQNAIPPFPPSVIFSSRLKNDWFYLKLLERKSTCMAKRAPKGSQKIRMRGYNGAREIAINRLLGKCRIIDCVPCIEQNITVACKNRQSYCK